MVLLLLCGVLLSGWLAYVVALRVGQAQIQATGLHRLELYTASLQREISKYAFLPGTLDLEKEVLALLAPDASAAQAEEVSAYLEQLNERAGTLSIYVINLDGRVVATQGLDTWGICSAPFLHRAFKTTEFRIKVTIHADGTWGYEEDTVLQIAGRDEPFHHTDRNTLSLIEPPTPNPLART